MADAQESAKGPEVDGGSQDMRETWMLLEYADRGNLDRALVHKKLMLDNGCLDMVWHHSSYYCPVCLSAWKVGASMLAALAGFVVVAWSNADGICGLLAGCCLQVPH